MSSTASDGQPALAAVDGGDAFPHLFSPLRIGPVLSRNRVIFGAHYSLLTERIGTSAEASTYGADAASYYADRAQGGAGVVIVGGAHTHPASVYEPANAIAWDERVVPHLRLVTEAISAHGALAFVQLEHKGSKRNAGWTDEALLAPSRRPFRHEVPKAADHADLASVVEHFARSTANVVDAGFVGIEVHGAHNYLLNAFMSPQSNRRDDEYGGSFENRMRLVEEVLGAVRQAAGASVAVGIRLAGDDPPLTPDAMTAEDAARIAAHLEQRGLVDFVNVSVGRFGIMVHSLYQPHLVGAYAAEAVRRAVRRTPVFAAQRIVTPAEAEAVLAKGQADAVTVVRALIADPEWAVKAARGAPGHIRQCTGCNQTCLGNLVRSVPLRCVTNPAVGRERTHGLGTLVASDRPRRIVVVGGGPAGLEAAWVAAARGHGVTLLERSERLGGKVRLAASLPGRSELAAFASWRADECARQGVDLRLGVDADVETILSLAPDAVVVATGGRAVLDAPAPAHAMPIPGSQGPNVHDHEAALAAPESLGQTVVILDVVGHVEGVGLAELLASGGRSVTLLTPYLNLPMLDGEQALAALRRAASAGARWMPATIVRAIEPGRVETVDTLSGRAGWIPADSVVIRGNGVPADELALGLEDKVGAVVRIGDAVAPRTVDRAVADGHRVGRSL